VTEKSRTKEIVSAVCDLNGPRDSSLDSDFHIRRVANRLRENAGLVCTAKAHGAWKNPQAPREEMLGVAAVGEGFDEKSEARICLKHSRNPRRSR
jgi:hypothetical protein